MRRFTVAAALTVAAVTAAATGCGGGSAAPKARPTPDLPAFLRLPVATPNACGGTVSGATAGRRSPWVGTVDISVFLETDVSPAQVDELRARLEALSGVSRVYFEPADEARAEFARLYTCSEDVPRSSIPASYRLVLAPMRRPHRDALVSQLRALPAVASVACDPSSPCPP